MKEKTSLLTGAFAALLVLLFATCDLFEQEICPPTDVTICDPLKDVNADEVIVELQPGYTADDVLDSCQYDFFVFQLATDFLGIPVDSILSITPLRRCNCNLVLLQITTPPSVDINNGHSGSMTPPEDQNDGNGLIASVGMNFNINIGPDNEPYKSGAVNAIDSTCVIYTRKEDEVEGLQQEHPNCQILLLNEIDDPKANNQMTRVAVIDTGTDPVHSYRGQNGNNRYYHNQIFYSTSEIDLFLSISAEIPNGGGIVVNDSDDDNDCVEDDLFGMDYFHEDNNPIDRKGHGTHVAGTILSGRVIANSGIRIMPLQIGGYEGNIYDQEHFRCDLFAIMCAIDYAVQNDANIINMSLGYYSPYYHVPFRRQIEKAVDAGILIVTSAGNDAVNIDDCHHWPSNFSAMYPENVIAVAALDTFTTTSTTYQLAPFSNYGQHADLAAPGWMIRNAMAGSTNGEIYLNGTSMAAAVVSRRAAMIRDSVMAMGGSITATELKAQILDETILQAVCVNGGRVMNPDIDTTLLSNIGYTQ